MTNQITLKELIKVVTKEDLNNFSFKTAAVSDLEENTVLNELTKLNTCLEMEQVVQAINTFPKYARDYLMDKGVTRTIGSIDLPVPVQLILLKVVSAISSKCVEYVAEMTETLEKKLTTDSYKMESPFTKKGEDKGIKPYFISDGNKFYMN